MFALGVGALALAEAAELVRTLDPCGRRLPLGSRRLVAVGLRRVGASESERAARSSSLVGRFGLDADEELLDDLHGLRQGLFRVGLRVELALEPVTNAGAEGLDRADVVQA